MAKHHTVHMGKIMHGTRTLTTILKPTRHELLYELNNWFFDYLYANQLNISSLPPLDDWTRSQENLQQWHIVWPDVEWSVIIESELLAFT